MVGGAGDGAREGRDGRGEAHHLTREVENTKDVVGGRQRDVGFVSQLRLGLRRRDQGLRLQVVRKRDGLDKLLQTRHVILVAAEAGDVVNDGGQELLHLANALLDLGGDILRDGLVELADSGEGSAHHVFCVRDKAQGGRATPRGRHAHW